MFEYDVFICHSSKDKPIIESLIKDLKKENITYWVDAEQIDFGDSITEKITEGLETSNYVIPCVSKNLKTSGWTRAEYGAILNAEFSGCSKRRVVPLLLEDCDVNDIPTLLRDKKRVTYSNKTEFKEFIEFLKKKRLKETSINSLTSSAGRSSTKLGNREIPKTFNSPSTGMEFVLIPAGKFIIGSPSDEKRRWDDEGPIHKVTIKSSFYMSKYPVTQKQWKKVMGNNPSKFRGEDRPVELISWNDVQVFIKKLNEKDSTRKYRLPSESEWEYACRAGTTTRYYFGEDESDLGDYAWYDKNSGSETHPVGQKKPNPWDLYDMHGNVWEWCQDNWHDNYNGAPSDGSAWEDGSSSRRVIRGGCWNSFTGFCRSAGRRRFVPVSRSSDLGFRLLRTM